MRSLEVDRILSSPNYYSMLQVTPEQCVTNPESINASYFQMGQQLAPDVCTDPRARQAFTRLSRARHTLLDPEHRSDSDLSLRNQQSWQSNRLFDCLAPVIVLVIGLLLWPSAFNVGDITSQKLLRKHLKAVLKFEPIPEVQTWQQKSLEHGVQYYVPTWWLENELNERMSRDKLVWKIADELWIEHLDIQCEVEKNVIGQEGRQCAKRKLYSE
jgi:curved DNA-binding protein CbpA